MAQPHTRSPVVGGKPDWRIAAGTGHLEPDRYPPANGPQCEGNCRMYACQSERYGATGFISAGSLARATRASAGEQSPPFPISLANLSIRASIKSRSSASYIWSKGTVKLSRICPFCGRILLDQRLRINDLAVAAGGENAAKLLNLTVPYYPWELQGAISSFVEHYNHRRYHESLNNVTPADVFFGRQQEILSRRERIKQRTLAHRRIANLRTGVL